MLKKIIFGVLALIAAVLIYATTRPDRFCVERMKHVQASPETIFPLINDLHRWKAWSPWEKLDPNMQRTHSGAASGKGAVYAWKGNSDVGEGRMEIIASTPSSRVAIKLDFIEPFEGHDHVVFTLRPHEDVTTVRWSMRGPMPYVAKLMSVFCNMDKMIGKDFEAGLANLKAVAEKS